MAQIDEGEFAYFVFIFGLDTSDGRKIELIFFIQKEAQILDLLGQNQVC